MVKSTVAYQSSAPARLYRVVALKHTQNLHSLHNYSYDKIGNLVADKSEEIEEISWTMQGKVKEIRRTTGSQKPDLVFNYDGLGNRVSKTVIPKSSVNNEDSITTYYVRDAQGNILATYEKTKYKNGDEKFYLKEQYLYGSTRIGMNVSNQLLASNVNGSVEIKEYDGYFTKTVGNKRYELTNHLGNVLAVVSDKKGVDNEPDVVSVSDYYPFGMTMPGRSFNANSYRHGFGSHEKDFEIHQGWYGFGDYGYDAMLGRRPRLDPVDQISTSNYATFGNNPLYFIDPDGRLIDPASQAEVDQMKTDITTQVTTLISERDAITTASTDSHGNVTYSNQQQTQINELNYRIGELNTAFSDISDMENAPNMTFRLNAVTGNIAEITPTANDVNNNTYTLNYVAGDIGNQIHEVAKHGSQILNGDLIYSVNASGNVVGTVRAGLSSYDLEVSAYRAQYSYNGFLQGYRTPIQGSTEATLNLFGGYGGTARQLNSQFSITNYNDVNVSLIRSMTEQAIGSTLIYP